MLLSMGPKYYKKKTNYPHKSMSMDTNGAIYLVIVESPSKCTKIESYLGHQYKCIASKGHIRELNGLKNIDMKNQKQLEEPNFEVYFNKFSLKKDQNSYILEMQKKL